MRIYRFPFNLKLLVLLSLPFWVCSCQTTESQKKKDRKATVIRFHLETNKDGTDRNYKITFLRNSPTEINVELSPFVDEGNISEARVIDHMGGFAIQVLLDKHGSMVLDGVTTGNKGKRIAIYSHWGPTRWIAAPLITRRVESGFFTFTPDTTREEAERIVEGLNEIAKAMKKKNSSVWR